MKVTKLVHSCLLVERDGKKALIDPGNFSWQSGVIDHALLKDIDYVCITHVHPDHFDSTFVNVVHELSPNALWYSTEEVVNALDANGIKAHIVSKLSDVTFIDTDHANLDPWFSVQPQHTSFILFGELLVSGDHQEHKTMFGARIMAGAFSGGPWGSVIGTAKMLKDIQPRPQKYIPLHDWHLNQGARSAFYDRIKVLCDEWGIEFIRPEDGVPVEL